MLNPVQIFQLRRMREIVLLRSSPVSGEDKKSLDLPVVKSKSTYRICRMAFIDSTTQMVLLSSRHNFGAQAFNEHQFVNVGINVYSSGRDSHHPVTEQYRCPKSSRSDARVEHYDELNAPML